jgi:FtsZ-binding cell division protein ZapB
MRLRLYLLLIVCLIFQSVKGQKPTVTDKFGQLFIGENFDSSNSYWSTISNLDNLLIVQEGEYIMQRKATFSPYAVMASFPSELSEYRLVASFKLDKTTAIEGSIGLIFMAQADGKGGFIFEINREQQYRLRQITNNTYRYITGTAQDGGWIKEDVIKGLNLPNLIEVRTAGKKYDLYINNKLVLNFSELEYNSGSVGFIIGPGSKGKADFIYIFTKSGITSLEETEVTLNNTGTPETDIIALAESIITLKTQINKLQEENDDLKGIIDGLKSGEKEQETVQANYDKYIKELEGKLKRSSASFDSLLKVNADLNKYKEMVKGNDNGDLVINLSKNLKNEKSNNENLRAINKAQADSIQLLKVQIKELKSNPAATKPKDPVKKEELPDKANPVQKSEFILPK